MFALDLMRLAVVRLQVKPQPVRPCHFLVMGSLICFRVVLLVAGNLTRCSGSVRSGGLTASDAENRCLGGQRRFVNVFWQLDRSRFVASGSRALLGALGHCFLMRGAPCRVLGCVCSGDSVPS